MLENVFPTSELKRFSRFQKNAFYEKSVSTNDLDIELKSGWKVKKHKKRNSIIVKEKSKADQLESRVWTMLYKMGFSYMSGKGGCFLQINPNDEQSPKTQIDVVAIDDEVGLSIECKSVIIEKRLTSFQDVISKHSNIRQKFSSSVSDQFKIETKCKRKISSIIFTWDIHVTENDKKRANEFNVHLFDNNELQYYESLVEQIGPAARYQLFSDLFPGQHIPGLEIRIPALRTKIGKLTYYTFSIKPEYLLKIAYISHRTKGSKSDIDTYQRMVKKTRLKKIAAYISNNGIFPTNIVININRKNHVRFDKAEKSGDDVGSLLGYITISATYGCAWVIDGQHRLLAYSGHKNANRDYLNVLAFEELPSKKQTDLFIDINNEQKSVKRTLLLELASNLEWDSNDPIEKVKAVITRVILKINEDSNSSLYNRIYTSDEKTTDTKCISLTSLHDALDKRLYIVDEKKGLYGPLWRLSSDDMLIRTKKVIMDWLNTIHDKIGRASCRERV